MAEKALQRHLWYLSEQGAALASFDKRASPDDRAAMVTNLSRPVTKKALKRLEKENFTLPGGLPELVTRRTLETNGVLAGRIVTTKNMEHVLQDSQTQTTARGLQVTNDAAERGVALMQRFQAWTKDEQQKQFLIKVVHHDCKDVHHDRQEPHAKFSPAHWAPSTNYLITLLYLQNCSAFLVAPLNFSQLWLVIFSWIKFAAIFFSSPLFIFSKFHLKCGILSICTTSKYWQTEPNFGIKYL